MNMILIFIPIWHRIVLISARVLCLLFYILQVMCVLQDCWSLQPSYAALQTGVRCDIMQCSPQAVRGIRIYYKSGPVVLDFN